MTDLNETEPQPVDDEPIHLWFELSYCNYLVVPRTLLQSMPAEWQAALVDLLDELGEAFRAVPQAERYEVIAGTEALVEDLTPGQRAQAGIDRGHDGERFTYYDRLGNELDGQDRAVLPTGDPVPGYQRGRTRVPIDREAYAARALRSLGRRSGLTT